MKTSAIIMLSALLPALAASEARTAAEPFEWTGQMRSYFRSAAAMEIVLDVTNPDDHRWIAFQMLGLRYAHPEAKEAVSYQSACGTSYGADWWLAGVRDTTGDSAQTVPDLLCVPHPTRLGSDLDWQRRVCRHAFHKRWNGRVSATRFSCRGQLTPAEIEGLEEEARRQRAMSAGGDTLSPEPKA